MTVSPTDRCEAADQTFDDSIVLGGGAEAEAEVDGVQRLHDAAESTDSAEKAQRLFAHAMAAKLPR